MIMRRLLLPLLLAIGLIGGSATTVASAAPAPPGQGQYVVTHTYTFNGKVPADDGEAPGVNCDPFDHVWDHKLRVDRMGGRRAVIVGKTGVTFDPDVDSAVFYAWVRTNGKRGTNKVIFTVTCRDTAKPYRT